MVGRDRRRQLRGAQHPQPHRARGDLLRPSHIESARQRLFTAREERVRPGLDDKVLTEWNALMLSSLAEAAAATGDPVWLEAAIANGEFLLANLRRDDGRWLRSWQADAAAVGSSPTPPTTVRSSTRSRGWPRRPARRAGSPRRAGVADAMLDLFWDDERSGLFTTGVDAERLITRDKDLQDNATPSANSLAAVALLRLAALTGEDRYRERAEAIIQLLGRLAVEHPLAFAHLLTAVDLLTGGITEVVVAQRPCRSRASRARALPPERGGRVGRGLRQPALGGSR